MQRNLVRLDFINAQMVIHIIIFTSHYLNVEFHGLKEILIIFVLGFLLMRLHCFNTDMNSVTLEMGIMVAAIQSKEIGLFTFHAKIAVKNFQPQFLSVQL